MHRVCMALSILLLVLAIAAVIFYSAWVEDGSPLRSLSTVRGIRPQPKLLSAVLKNPQMLSVIYHGQLGPGEMAYNESSMSTHTLLVLVDSQPGAYERRMAVRNTWMKYPSIEVNVAVLFTITEKGQPLEVVTELSVESAKYQDMVVYRGVSDCPESERLLYQLLWSEQNVQYKHILRTRDNFYVRVEELLHDVRRITKNTSVYWGYFDGRQRPGQSTKLPEPEWFLCNTFVRFAHSGGYIISRQLVRRLLGQAEYLQLYNNEDVALSIWLSPYSDVEWRHDPRFDTEEGRPRGCRNDYLVFPVNSTLALVKVHKRALESGRLCETEYEQIQSYYYNFESPVDQCCSPI